MKNNVHNEHIGTALCLTEKTIRYINCRYLYKY